MLIFTMSYKSPLFKINAIKSKRFRWCVSKTIQHNTLHTLQLQVLTI